MYPMPHVNRNFCPRVLRSKDSGQGKRDGDTTSLLIVAADDDASDGAFASGRSSALEAISFLVASSVSSFGDSGFQPYRTLMVNFPHSFVDFIASANGDLTTGKRTSTKPHRTVPDGSRPCSR
jgi:hypothetical protein